MTQVRRTARDPEQPALPVCSDHRVEFYDGDAAFIDSVVGFLQPSRTDGVAIMIAAADHRELFARALEGANVDGVACLRSGRLVVLDAAATLERLVVDGSPHPPAFRRVVGGLLDNAERAGGPVRVYGEMVAVLWGQGRVGAAMELEDLWNDLATTHAFALLCGYPSALFAHRSFAPHFELLLGQHTAVTLAPDRGLTRLASAAVLAAHPGQQVVQWKLPAELTSGARVRALLRELLPAWELAGLLEDVELLASELINNAVVHARTTVLVSVRRVHDALRVEITDAGEGALHRSDNPPDGTRGRGLLFVDALSAAWGTTRRDGAKTVWFELRHG